MTFAIAVLYLSVITICDLATRRISNYFSMAMAIFAICLHLHQSGWQGLSFSAIGLGTGFLLLLLPFLGGGLGGGDVKAMAALGALLGPPAIFQTFLYTALFGGVIALIYFLSAYHLRTRTQSGYRGPDLRSRLENSAGKPRFPYSPAMALGYLAYVAWGDLI